MPSAAYTEARDRVRAAKREAQEIAKESFSEEAKALLGELGITSFAWRQYTPYFNDGDACVFGIYADDPTINGLDEYETPGRPIFSYGAAFDALPQEEKDRQNSFREPFRRVAQFVNSWEEEDLLFMFGDHALVEVSDTGIVVEEYQHD